MKGPQKFTLGEGAKWAFATAWSIAQIPLQLFPILPPQLKTRWLQFGHGISGLNQLGIKGNLLIHWGMYAKGRAGNGFGYGLDDLGGLFRR
jgi:hypothetical protein